MKPSSHLEAALRPFLAQSVRVASVVALGWGRLSMAARGTDAGDGDKGAARISAEDDAVLCRVSTTAGAVAGGGLTIAAPVPIPPPGEGAGGGRTHTLASLARHALVLSKGTRGDHLLVLSGGSLEDMIGPDTEELPFRGVVIVSLHTTDQRGDGLRRRGDVWKLQRILFDRGLVAIGSVHLWGGEARCFLASDGVRSVRRLGAGTRGHITMACLGRNGRFANQLFQYAYARLYGLRHGATAAVPPWEGQQLFGLDDPPCAGLGLPRLTFKGFDDEDLRLWERSNPPIDVDLWGYFQEIPDCWRKHRPLLRRMFQLPRGQQRAIDAWHDEVTRGGRRPLVAIHVRRGDYRRLQHLAPWFRLVPEKWYLAWLRRLWPALRNPVLFVATDEPDAIRPLFREFKPVWAAFAPPARALPDHVRDFEVLRRADYLAICNSSYSRMASILADPAQRCVLPSFDTQRLEPYEPWVDPGFWARFATASRTDGTDGADRPGRKHTPPPRGKRRQPAPSAQRKRASGSAPTSPAIYFDVSDLLQYVRDHTTLSGIQRVQCEIMRNLLAVARPEPVRLVALDDARRLCRVETPPLLDILARMRAKAEPRSDLDDKLGALRARMASLSVRPGEVFLYVGAFWGVSGVGLLFQDVKNRGGVVGVFIHDILSITDPEYFDVRDTRIFTKGLVEALTFADFLITTSEYNKASLVSHLAARSLPPRPIRVVPLAHELSPAAAARATVSPLVKGITEKPYVLCVGTIEARKNPTYLFNVWKRMVRAGRANIPTLVFVGRRGWLVQDFMKQLKACNYLDDRIVILHDVTDVELDLLYRKCLVTMFPSWAEGWGLPVGESLGHGKICIASRAGAISEVGGEWVDYIDPYNISEGLEVLARYLDDPALRRRREREIVRSFRPRRWRQVADDFLQAAHALAPQVRPAAGTAAIRLPPNRYLPISNDVDAIELDGIDGELSADLICISGWRAPEIWGVWADAPSAVLRFRTALPAGTRINLLMRLRAAAGNGRPLRISSGSGAKTEASLAGASDRLAVLSCEVEPGDLVSVRMSMVAPVARARRDARPPYWGLRGILYFRPDDVAGREAAFRALGDRSTQDRPAPISAPKRAAVPPARRGLSSLRRTVRPGRVRLPLAAPMDEGRRAASLDAFHRSTDSYWPSPPHTSDRRAPIVADDADRQIFSEAHGGSVGTVSEQITLIRRSDQYVSMSRFSEGAAFDRSGISRAFGYLNSSPPLAWLSRDPAGMWVDEQLLAAAPRYEKSYLIFYNGNLHNYYHWMTEAILCLDILSRAIGPNPNVNIALPKSMDINAVFDHRESLRALGLDRYDVVEVAADLIQVREAIWVDSDLVQSMPPPYLQDFRQRVAARYAASRGPRKRRLLVARKGPTRMIDNLGQVEAFLSRHAFETVYLEGMSVVDQILLFQRAEFVISPHGAGLANLLFCEAGTRVIELTPSVEMRPFFWLISEKLSLVHGVLFCPVAEGRGFQGGITIDISNLRALYGLVEADSYGSRRLRVPRG